MSDERDPYSMNGSVEARVNRYQNKAPQTLSERDYYHKTIATNNSDKIRTEIREANYWLPILSMNKKNHRDKNLLVVDKRAPKSSLCLVKNLLSP
jgi:hypothetical protein